ncbi:MAG TPA: enoyl-CoA hydratase/isomerase family protein [Smithellaceae bacterium]|nr:enoyl-CoA hydratase/isomerase family protein [Smithellaceae bacterium]
MNYETLLIEKKKGYAVIRLNRPHEMNAFSMQMRLELDSSFAELENDNEVNSIVLTGGEYVFSAGMDIKEMSALPDSEIDQYFATIMNYLKRIYVYPKTVIAAVGGIALGGGFNLVTVCDLVIASESAIFCHPELKFGLNPLVHPLSQIVGMNKAREIVMLGEPIGANEAMRLGIVNKVFPPEKFMSEAERIAETLASRSPKAVAELKRMCNVIPQLDKEVGLDMEANVGVRLFARDERKLHMNEILFLEKLRKKKQK